MEMRSLPVVLTTEEYKVRADQLAQKIKDLRSVESAKKATAEDFKMRMEGLTTEINLLSTVVKENKEYRPVECYEIENWQRFTMDLVRRDTGELVDSRPMMETERQAKLFPIDGGKDDAEKGKGKKKAAADEHPESAG